MVRWIGRTAMWKGPNLMIDFHQDELMDNGFITVLEGLEASIQYPLVLYRDNAAVTPVDRRKVMNYFRQEKQYDSHLTKFTSDLYSKEVEGVGAYLYPGYINSDAMERMARSAFGSDLYYLKAETYGNNIENCHAEIIASGSVPLFHKHFCDNVIHKVQDGKLRRRLTGGRARWILVHTALSPAPVAASDTHNVHTWNTTHSVLAHALGVEMNNNCKYIKSTHTSNELAKT